MYIFIINNLIGTKGNILPSENMDYILQNGIYQTFPENGTPPINYPNIHPRALILILNSGSHVIQYAISYNLEYAIRFKVEDTLWGKWKVSSF